MIYCPVCNTANRTGSKFCNKCGASFGEPGLICPECASANIAGSRFCRSCGQPIADLVAPMQPASWTAIDALELEDELPSFEADVPSMFSLLPALEEPETEMPTGDSAPIKVQDSESGHSFYAAQDSLDPVAEATEPAISPDAEGMLRPDRLPEWLDIPESTQSPPALPTPLEIEEPEVLSERTLPACLDLSDDVLAPEASPEVRERPYLPAWLFLPELDRQKARALPAWLDDSEESFAKTRSLPDWLEIAEPARARALHDWLLEFEVEETGLLDPLISTLPSLLPSDEAAASDESRAADPRTASITAAIVSPGIALARPFQGQLAPTLPAAEQDQGQGYEAVFADILQSKSQITATASLPGTRRFTLLSLLLVVVISIPLLFPMGINLEPQHDTSVVFDIIQALPPAANVLVTFDWTPGTDEEMAPIAEALVRHLVSRKAKIVAVSLIPEGGKLAQRVLDRALQGTRGYEYGNQVVNLGYLPGGEVAIRNMMADLSASYGVDHFGIPTKNLPILKAINSLKSADLVVILSSEPEVLTSWVTQVSATFKGIRMVAGLSSAALPWAQPYSSASNAAQLKGKLVGIRGAAEYELVTNEPGFAISATDAQSFGGVFLALVIVAGNFAYLRSMLKKPKRGSASQPG
ncbi:MAG: zinc ribbon domain-containing protein [Dehalococcoidia bacterium]|nr:zinc ribbon domain-containing protein [Dehalococcoidia bacterium]